MRLKRFNRNLFVAVLVASLTVTGIEPGMKSNLIQAEENQQISSEGGLPSESLQSNEPEVVRELVNERTENTNTFLMSDGSKRTEIYSEDIRFKKNGKYVDFDNSLKHINNADKIKLDEIAEKNSIIEENNISKYTYTNTRSDAKTYFAEEIGSDNPIILTKDCHSIALTPLITYKTNNHLENANEEEETYTEAIYYEDITEDTDSLENTETENSQENGEITGTPEIIQEIGDEEIKPSISSELLNNDDSVITYRDEENNTTYQYRSLNNGIKEDVIFYEKPDRNILSYEFSLVGMYMEKDNQFNRINIYDSETKKKTAYIGTPYMYDNTEFNTSFNVLINVDKLDNTTWCVDYILDEEYLNNKATQYPVTLDPRIEWTGWEDVDIGPTMSGQGQNSNVYNDAEFYVGTITSDLNAQANIRFPGLYNTLKGKNITKAYFSMIPEVVYNNPSISVYPVIGDWQWDTVTWNTRPQISSTYLTTVTSGYISANNPTYFYFKKWIQDVAAGTVNGDNGLAFEGTGGYVKFYGPGTGTTAPKIVVEYNNPEEIEASSYDGSFEMNAEYNIDEDSFDITWEDYSNDISYYKICTRSESENFVVSGTTEECTYSLDATQFGTYVDIRVMAVNENVGFVSDVYYLSNINSFEASEEIEELTEPETETETEPGTGDTMGGEEDTIKIYSETVSDTDADGLEDGYEIWDFKTLWNTETPNSTEENPEYDTDSDDDGFPDGYEVFVLETNPMISNPINANSDNDVLNDLQEFNLGTDPWLENSDFDEYNDGGEQYPRHTDGETSQSVAADAVVHVGFYDRTYSETEDGVVTTYIKNIYSGLIKSVYKNYGDTSINKTKLYFYDAKGNNTAIVEKYDNSAANVICVTYEYDSNGNVCYICDQKSKYTIGYDSEGKRNNISVGNQTMMSKSSVTNEVTTEESAIPVGEIVRTKTDMDSYGNNQQIRSVSTQYKVYDEVEEETEEETQEETTEPETDLYENVVASKTEVFYDNNTDPAYEMQYNHMEKPLRFIDYTKSLTNPDIYTYTESENSKIISRNDGFVKTEITSIDDDNQISNNSVQYTYKNLLNLDGSFGLLINSDNSEEDIATIQTSLTNGVISLITENNNDDVITNTVKKENETVNILSSTETKNSNTLTTYQINTLNGNNVYQYAYNLAGNITSISKNNTVLYEYTYDGHSRLVGEKNYVENIEHVYVYNSTGNMGADWTYSIDENGNRIGSGIANYFQYTNNQWKDQMSGYAGETFTYDSIGNPLEYRDGMEFTWERGRSLHSITTNSLTTATYRYNENNLRTYKQTQYYTTTYEWERTNLIRETITYSLTNKTYDIWYMYNGNGDMIGFQYSQLNAGNIETKNVYFENDMLGNVIGLLDENGNEIATYSYDAWGNITDSSYVSGNELAFSLNHIVYKGYYRDNESGFYYLQSRYYDPTTHRFLNSDDFNMLTMSFDDAFKDNLYIYCNGNPVNRLDDNGKWYYSVDEYYKYVKKLKNKKDKTSADSMYKSIRGKWLYNMQIYSHRKKPYAYITGQGMRYIGTLCIGDGETIGHQGCGIVALYNVMKMKKKKIYFPDLIAECELNGVYNHGITNFEFSRRYLLNHGINSIRCKKEKEFYNKQGKHKYFMLAHAGHAFSVKRKKDKKGHTIYVAYGIKNHGGEKLQRYVYNSIKEIFQSKCKKYADGLIIE